MRVAVLSRLVFCCLLSMGVAVAAPEKEIKHLNIIQNVKGQIRQVPLAYDSLQPNFSLTLISPHPSKNPKKERRTWSGIRLRELVKRAGVRLPANETVSVVASDQYTLELRGADLQNNDVMVSTHLDGQPLTWAQGGPQLVWPLRHTQPPALFDEDRWWAWYVSALFVGDIPPLLSVQDGTETKQIDLRREAGGTERDAFLSCPPASRLEQAPRKKVRIRSLPIKALLAPGARVAKVRLTTYFGETLERDYSDQFEFRFGWNGNLIKPPLGGPIQFCRQNGVNSCVFFIRSLEWVPTGT